MNFSILIEVFDKLESERSKALNLRADANLAYIFSFNQMHKVIARIDIGKDGEASLHIRQEFSWNIMSPVSGVEG